MILDIIIVAVLLVSAVVAFFRGFIKEVLTIVGLGGAAFGAFLFGGKAVPVFEGWIVNPDDPDFKFFDIVPADIVALLLAYLTVFVIIFIALAAVGHFLSKGAAALGLGPVDRSLGVLFGLARGVVLVTILYLPFSLIMTDEEFPDFVQESRLIPIVDTVTDWAIDVAELEKPLEEIEEETDGGKLSGDMIDKVREEYIDGKKPETDNEKTEGYGAQERDALDDLIEEESETYND